MGPEASFLAFSHHFHPFSTVFRFVSFCWWMLHNDDAEPPNNAKALVAFCGR